MRTVCFLITDLQPGGAETALVKLLPRLQAIDPFVVTLKGRGELSVALAKAGVSTVHLNPQGRFRLLPTIGAFRKVMQQRKPEVIVTILPHADLFGRVCGRLSGVPNIVTYLRAHLDYHPKYRWVFLMERLTSRLVIHYLAVSQSVKERYATKGGIPKQKITVMPNGITPEQFNAPIDKVAKKRMLGIDPAVFIIGTVGRLRPEKCFDTLIEAFSLVAKEYPRTHLVFAGDGPEEKRLKHCARLRGVEKNTHFLGNREDVPELLQIFDIFVLPSVSEGMSNALLEAAAAGCAIVASDIPANREIIQQETTGLLVETKNHAQLAQAIVRLLQNTELRSSLGKAAKEKVQRDFDLAVVAKRIETFLLHLAKS